MSCSASMPARPYTRVKLVSLGDSCVGKSCLIKRYCERKFVARYIATLGVDFGVRSVPLASIPGAPPQPAVADASAGDEEEATLKVNFFDLSGSVELASIRSDFHRDAQATLLVFDVTRRETFDHLSEWMDEHRRAGARPLAVAVCANKVDEPSSARAVSESDGRRWAGAQGFLYFETSSKSGLNVNELFQALFAAVVKANG